LNPESEIADTSWIHAGRASWDWWTGSLGPDGKRAYTTETMKCYVDFAAKSVFEYMMLDAGWSDPDDVTKMNGTVDVPELVGYAKEKGAKVWIWLLGNQADRQMDEARTNISQPSCRSGRFGRLKPSSFRVVMRPGCRS
jgi:alpha-glucosidase